MTNLFLRATVKLERFIKLKNLEGNNLGINSKKFEGDPELEYVSNPLGPGGAESSPRVKQNTD